jgi:hypothetical protein
MTVAAAKVTVEAVVSDKDFEKCKASVRKENVELIKKIQKQIPGWLSKASKNVGDQYGQYMDLTFDGAVCFPVHGETKDWVAFSAAGKASMKDAEGRLTHYVNFTTTTILHVGGKVLFLCVKGDEDDLQWTRTISENWAEAILAANPPNPADAPARLRQKEHYDDFDLSPVQGAALVVGLVALFGLFRLMSGRSKGT